MDMGPVYHANYAILSTIDHALVQSKQNNEKHV